MRGKTARAIGLFCGGFSEALDLQFGQQQRPGEPAEIGDAMETQTVDQEWNVGVEILRNEAGLAVGIATFTERAADGAEYVSTPAIIFPEPMAVEDAEKLAAPNCEKLLAKT
jgi:hypothetical protein